MAEDEAGDAGMACHVCTESVQGLPYLVLGMFGVFPGNGNSGLFFHPEIEPYLLDDWEDVYDRVLHVSCIPKYIEGLLVEIDYLQKQEQGECE